MNIKKVNLNQSGASAIMFTMFFIVVISLLTVGFATLVRKDQRSTLDKTLSLQAEYAAESGVNAVKNYIQEFVKINSVGPNDSAPCQAVSSISEFVSPQFNNNAEITCYNWRNGVDEFVISGLDFNTPAWIPFTSINPPRIRYVDITWTGQNTIAGCSKNNINNITNLTFPVLRIVTSETNLGDTSVNYLCPTQTELAPHGQPADANQDGSIAAAHCSLPNGPCTARISNPKNGYLAAIKVQGGSTPSTVTIRAIDDLNQVVRFKDTYSIDITAKSQDIIKRSYATIVPGGGAAWSPGQFVVGSNNQLCKNYKVDGGNNEDPGPINETSTGKCP